MNITERTQLEHELQLILKSTIVAFVNDQKTFAKLEELVDENVVSNVHGALKALAFNLSPASLDVSSIIDLVKKERKLDLWLNSKYQLI